MHDVDVEDSTPLLYVLRNDLGLSGPRFGCGLAQCGTCTVLVEGTPIRSCVTPVSGVADKPVTTLEGLGNRTNPHPIQEAFIIGSTVGMSAVGCKPIVEVQFADYIWPGLNQLFTEVSRSCYLSRGKWPVSCIIRVPIGAYGSGGPYHSSSVESILASIQGIKIACLEEISLFKRWINKKIIIKNIKFYGNCEYSNYLKKI